MHLCAVDFQLGRNFQSADNCAQDQFYRLSGLYTFTGMSMRQNYLGTEAFQNYLVTDNFDFALANYKAYVFSNAFSLRHLAKCVRDRFAPIVLRGRFEKLLHR